jgi:hypothetical protein
MPSHHTEPEIIRNVDEYLHYCMDAKKSQWDSIGGTVRLYACHSASNSSG